MTSNSESGTGRAGLLASIGRLFGGAGKRGPSDSAAEGDKPVDLAAASGVAEPRGSSEGQAGDMSNAPTSGANDSDEDELVLGPSLKASPDTPETEPAAAPVDADDGLVLGSRSNGETPDEAAPAVEAAPEEETILARLRAVREEQGEGEAGGEQQWAAPSEDTWAAAFASADAEPAQERDAGTGPSWGSSEQHDDARRDTPADHRPEDRKLVEDADTGPDDERGSTDDSPIRDAGTAPETPAGAVPLFPRQEPNDAAEEASAWSADEAGDQPAVAGAEEQGIGIWNLDLTEPEPRGSEPAAAGGHEVGIREPEASEVDTPGAEDPVAEPEEREAAAPDAADAEDLESDTPVPEVGEPGAEPIEAAHPDMGDTDVGSPGVSEAETALAAEAEEPEEALPAGEDETAPADAEVVALGAAGMPSEAEEPTAEEASDEAAAAGLDEARVEEIVRRLIREELEGELGERLSANIRRVVREEVSRALLRDR